MTHHGLSNYPVPEYGVHSFAPLKTSRDRQRSAVAVLMHEQRVHGGLKRTCPLYLHVKVQPGMDKRIWR